VTRKRKILKI